jgi:cell division protein FtsW
MARKLSSDKSLFTITIALIMFGLVMIYSASAVLASDKFGDPFHYVVRQLIWFGIGIAAMAVIMNVHYRKWNNRFLIYGSLLVSCAFLVLVLFAPAVNNVHRWFRIGPISIQPAEIAKFPLILFLSYHLARRQGQIESFFYTILPALLVCGQMAFLVVVEPDLGTAIMFVSISIGLLFLAGMPLKYFAGFGLLCLPILYVLVMHVGYRRQRLLSFMNPESDPSGSAFQIIQSLIAMGTGGVHGAGLANGIQKLFYLPEPHTDFIYAIIGEELGLIGAGALLLAYIFFLWRGLRIAWKVADPFGQFMAAGITIMIVLQAFINISVVIGLVPTKGLPLPFISSGGSSLLVNMIGVGALLNISQHV